MEQQKEQQNQSRLTPEEIDYWFNSSNPKIQQMHEQLLKDGYSKEYIAEMEAYFG